MDSFDPNFFRSENQFPNESFTVDTKRFSSEIETSVIIHLRFLVR